MILPAEADVNGSTRRGKRKTLRLVDTSLGERLFGERFDFMLITEAIQEAGRNLYAFWLGILCHTWGLRTRISAWSSFNM